MSGAEVRMDAGRVKAWGLALGVVSSVTFGTSGPFGKALINAGFSPLQASWTRVAGATLILVPLVLALRGRAAMTAARRHWPLLLVYGTTGVAGCQSFYFVAASRLPVGVAILLEFTGPLIVVGWIRFVRRAPLPRSAALGVGIALVGLACVVEVWSGLSLDLVGVLAGLGAAACQATFFLIVDRVGDQIDPLVMTAAGTTVAAVLLAGIAAPWGLPWHLLGSGVPLGDGTAPGWFLAVWLIVVSTVIAYATSVAAVHRLSAPVAGAVGYVEAVSAGLFAWVVLGENMSPIQLAGGAIVLTGAFVAQRSAVPVVPAVEDLTAARPAAKVAVGRD
jgi:drug/metabolite transporter (DMT)-like permease